MAEYRSYTTDITGKEFQLPNGPNCFSFRVRAICEDGSESPFSAKFCSNDMLDRSMNSGSVNSGEGVEVEMYPNPTDGMVSFNLDMPTDMLFNMTVTDISGKMVKSVSGLKGTGKKASLTFSTEGMSKGIYTVLFVMQSGENISKKLVVE